MTSKLFEPIRLGGTTLSNRVAVSPMCQYSADDGSMTDWHLMHLGSMAICGAGLVMIEATGVTREGRITHGCTGLYHDSNEAAMKRVVDACRRLTQSPIGIQLAHAGRKASAQVPWAGGRALKAHESPWQTVAPSALAYGETWHTPQQLDLADLDSLVAAFAGSAKRALRIGLDLIELHSAHGYLMHQFLSPLSNHRKDAYGGSPEKRMRFPLEVAKALREAWPEERILGARITASDWAERGATPEDAVRFARELKGLGFDYVCVSSGGVVSHQKISVGPGYQVAFAEEIRNGAGIPVQAVGMIAAPQQAEDIIASGKADMVALARGLLDNPRWVWHAAQHFGVKLDYPPQYARSHHSLWPGAAIARPRVTEAAE